MAKDYDLVVIGTGTAASTAASKCRKAGWSVAMIDSRPFGGTCALRGCDPKKVLVRAAELADRYDRARDESLLQSEIRLSWPQLMRFKRSFTDPVPKSREESFAKQGIDTYRGRARFTGPATVDVDGQSLTGKRVLIASGAKPRALGIPGEELITTSDQFLELESLPPRIVFVGGGYISFEFAHVAARLGAAVTILHRSPQPLRNFDPDVVGKLLEATRAAGVEVRLDAPVDRIEKSGDDLRVHVKGDDASIVANLVVHGAGRVPEIDDLHLENANVERDTGVLVDEYLNSVSNDAVYAAGDAAQTEGAPLTPVAAYEGMVAAANLLEPKSRSTEYVAIPSVVFTIPPLASVGLLESEAKKQGRQFHTNTGDSSDWFTSRHEGNKHAAYKVLVEEDSDHILGAHLLGPHAEEVINVFAVAMRANMIATDLKRMTFAYPTSGSDIPYML